MTVDSFPPVAAAITGVDSLCKRFAATLNESVAGGIWRSSNANASVAAGVVTGTNIGMDTIIYKITNGCGVDSVTKTINIKDCSAGLANLSSSQMMNVWPNPNDGTFTLYLPEAINEPLQITITNMLGEKIKALTGQTNMTLDINLDAAAGVYFLSVNTIEGIGNTKVIVTK
jgi:hypothetical protein